MKAAPLVGAAATRYISCSTRATATMASTTRGQGAGCPQCGSACAYNDVCRSGAAPARATHRQCSLRGEPAQRAMRGRRARRAQPRVGGWFCGHSARHCAIADLLTLRWRGTFDSDGRVCRCSYLMSGACVSQCEGGGGNGPRAGWLYLRHNPQGPHPGWPPGLTRPAHGKQSTQVGMLSYAPQLARAPSWLSPRRQRPRTCNTEHQRCATWKNTADPQTQCGPREGISFQSATLATNKCTKTWRHLPPVSRTILPRDVVAAHLGSTSGAAQGTPLRAHDASMAW